MEGYGRHLPTMSSVNVASGSKVVVFEMLELSSENVRTVQDI